MPLSLFAAWPPHTAERLCLSVSIYQILWRGSASPLRARRLRSQYLLDPIGDEDVRVAAYPPVAIRSEDKFLPIRRKHRETIKRLVVGNSFQTCTVDIDFVE